MAELAVIPPYAHTDLADSCQIHLALSHAMRDPRYVAYYSNESDRGKYVILDNSQHEDFDFPIGRLIRDAELIGASEIAFPDVKYACDATLARIRSSIASIRTTRSNYDTVVGLRPAWLLIPQGSSYSEWVRCFRKSVSLHIAAALHWPELFSKDPTIGFPLKYVSKFTAVELRRAFIEELEPMGLKVHLLGWDPSPFEHVRRLCDQYGEIIRSIDTAKPIVYAMTGTRIGKQKYPGRPEGYFGMQLTDEQLLQARLNIIEFRRQCYVRPPLADRRLHDLPVGPGEGR